MKDIDPGRLRHRVTINLVTPQDQTTDAFGAPTLGLSPTLVRYAAIEPLTGRELWAAQQVQADTTHKVTLRYTPGIKASSTLTFQGRTFQVLSLQNIEEQSRWLILMCKEQLSG